MKTKLLKNKTLFLHGLILILFFIWVLNDGCSNDPNPDPNIKVFPLTFVSENSNSWGSTSTSYVGCDSVQFISSKEAFVWRNGTKMKIIADKVRVYSNDN